MNDGVYVGSARVLSCEADGRPHVQVLGGACDTVTADWAMPYRYEPQPGDLLLVLGQRGRYWVTGIVHGQGQSHLIFQGNTQLRASGTMNIAGDGGVRLDSTHVRIETGTLETTAKHIAQRIDEFDSSVAGTIEERTGECLRVIDENDDQTAFRHTTVANHVVKRDAKLLRLS